MTREGYDQLMNRLQQLGRASIIVGVGLVILSVSIVIISFLQVRQSEKLSDILPFERTILYLRSHDPERARAIATPLGFEVNDTLQQALSASKEWFELAIVANGSGGELLSLIAVDGKILQSVGEQQDHSFSKLSGIDRFVETEDRDVLWYKDSVFLSSSKSILSTLLFGGQGILILPDAGKAEGRIFISGGSVPLQGQLPLTLVPNTEADLSLAISSPLPVLEAWIQILKDSDRSLEEGISGIIAAKLQERDPETLQGIAKRPMRIDMIQGKDGSNHILLLGSRLQKKDDIFALLNADGGSVRTLLDEKGTVVRKDLIAESSENIDEEMRGNWTIRSIVAGTPLFAAQNESAWAISDSREMLTAWIDREGEPPQATTSGSRSFLLHMNLTAVQSILSTILPPVGRETVTHLQSFLENKAQSIDLSAELIGNGIMVRWKVSRTFDEVPLVN